MRKLDATINFITNYVILDIGIQYIFCYRNKIIVLIICLGQLPDPSDEEEREEEVKKEKEKDKKSLNPILNSFLFKQHMAADI